MKLIPSHEQTKFFLTRLFFLKNGHMQKGLLSNFWYVWVTAICCYSCIIIEQPYSKLPPGKWVGVLKLDKYTSGTPFVRKEDINPIIKFEPVNLGELPFEFEVYYPEPDSMVIHLINDTDTMVITDIIFNNDKSKAKDTFEIRFPIYNTVLKGFYEENVMEGDWIVLDKENYKIPFVAKFGQAYKFTDLKKKPVTDISGLWEVTMGIDTDKPSKLVANFSQSANDIRGSFSGKTGDYRFLSGTVQHNKVYLSQFDGATAYLIEAKIENDTTLTGIFRSGKHYQAIWSAKKTSDAKLDDSFEEAVRLGTIVDFNFPLSPTDTIKLSDLKFQGKPKILQLLGTWCHNCYDEGRYLSKLSEKYKDSMVFIGLAIERAKDPADAFRRIKEFKEQTKVNYPIALVSTTTDKAEVLNRLPFLQDIFAYPTTIFLDKNNRIIGVKSGFFGPASHLHDQWASEFQASIEALLSH